jgi:hypothetical protein
MQCRAGDFFICAGERQRDWWLGLLEAMWGASSAKMWQRWGEGLWMVGVSVMWLALLAGGFVRWLPISGRAMLELAAWASVPIVIGAALMLIPFARARRDLSLTRPSRHQEDKTER